MTPPPLNEQEMVRVAASIRLTGELLEANGTRALVATASWQRGPVSPSLDPGSGGWRYDAAGEPVPNDPAGEAAMVEDPYATTADELRRLITTLDRDATRVRQLLYAACPQSTQPTAFEPDTPAQISAAGWCVSCHRDGGYCEPVSMRPDGQRRYRDYCTWCGTYIADARKQPVLKAKRRKARTEESYWPPLELVQARHRGERISTQMVERAQQRTSTRKAS